MLTHPVFPNRNYLALLELSACEQTCEQRVSRILLTRFLCGQMVCSHLLTRLLTHFNRH